MWEGFTIIFSISLCVTLVLILFGCVCGCRKDVHKSELVGTAGVVKLHSEEEASATSQTSPLSTKRASSQNQRSLPEIPPAVPRQDSGDTASDLYATVGTHQRVSEQSSPTTTRISEFPYEHAYARLQDGSLRTDDSAATNENAVHSSASNNTLPIPLADATPEDSQSSNDAIVITASVAISGQVSSSRDLPYMTPPVVVSSAATTSTSTNQPPPIPAVGVAPDNRTQHQHFSGDSVDSAKGYTSISVREPLSSIRAATAGAQSQPHYATVSDDSDEMYAAIDEPANSNNPVYTSGSETYAQIQPVTTVRTQATLHQPPTQPSTSSATGGVVPSTSSPNLPTGAPAIGHASTSVDTVHHIQETVPRQSASESIKQGILAKHTRQASNSSCNSSVGTVGSPKPEKRQANSPLPPTPGPSHSDASSHTNSNVIQAASSVPPPASSTSHGHRKKDKSRESAKQRISSTGDLHNNPEKLRRSLNEKHQRNNSCVSSSDFYGCNYPVDKHRYSSGDLARSLVAKEINFSLDNAIDKQKDALYNSIDGNDIYAAIDQSPPKSLPNVTSSPSKNVEEMYAKVIKKSRHSQERAHSFAKLLNNEDVEACRNVDINGVKLRKKSVQHEDERSSGNNFTNIPIPSDVFRNSPSPKTPSIKEDPGYETIDRVRNKNHSYETIDKNVAKHKTADRNSDPGYETVKDPVKFKRIETVSGRVAQHFHHMIGMEPGYETLPSGPNSIQSLDPGYEHIRGLERCPSDADPNYEELTTHKTQASYATANKSSIPGYSVINKKSKATEKDWSMNNNENFNSEPNYESMPHEPFYTTGSETDSNYETVGPKDANYESVKYFDMERGEPPYEKVKNKPDSGSKVKRTGSSSSGYERVKNILKRDEDQNDNRTNGLNVNASGDIAPVGDYFQV